MSLNQLEEAIMHLSAARGSLRESRSGNGLFNVSGEVENRQPACELQSAVESLVEAMARMVDAVEEITDE